MSIERLRIKIDEMRKYMQNNPPPPREPSILEELEDDTGPALSFDSSLAAVKAYRRYGDVGALEEAFFLGGEWAWRELESRIAHYLKKRSQYFRDVEIVAKHWYVQRYTKLYGDEVDAAYQRLLAVWRKE
jgi:hypothetical protein